MTTSPVDDAARSSTLVEAARYLLSSAESRGLTVAVAESLTGGDVVSALVSVPGASTVVVGGVVAYATRIKAQVLGVDERRLERTGPVDGEVAEQMASGVAALMETDLGLATTGVAGPRSRRWPPCGNGACGGRLPVGHGLARAPSGRGPHAGAGWSDHGRSRARRGAARCG